MATSVDVPGLVAEGATVQELQAKLDILIPELLELNGSHIGGFQEVPMVIRSERTSMVRVPV